MKKSRRIIVESGNAAIALIDKKLSHHPDNENRDLFYGRITDEELDSIFPKSFGVFPSSNDDSYIGKLLYALGEKGLVDTSYTPSFSLGSTRLAALKKYGRDSIGIDRYETDDVIATASNKKISYGDLDIDLVFVADKKEIAQAIEQIDPSVYATAVSKEVHVAIRAGEKVIQVDLVDVSEGGDAMKFLQKSSFVDLAEGIKGAFSILLLRAAAAVMHIGPEDTVEHILDFAESNPNSDFSKDLKYKVEKGYTPVGTRFSLGDKGLKLVVDLEKENARDPNKKVKSKIDFDPEVRKTYNDLDSLAKAILQNSAADSSTIFSATKLAQFVRTHLPSSRKDLLWQAFEASAEKNLQNYVSEQDYNLGMATLSTLMGIEWTPKASSLNEARESVGRFVGKNQFNNKSLMMLLRTLVRETGNEGQSSFLVDLKESPAVDIVEKMDSNFAHFGVSPEGEFFMESSNSGPVTVQNAEDKFGFSQDFLEPFKWLAKSKPFQTSLRNIYQIIGPFKYDAELFPILTHEGDESGNVTFVATPYSKRKFGKFGGFVVFKAQLWNDETQSWVRPEPAENVGIVNLIKKESFDAGWTNDWRIYTNEEDMKHPVKLQIEMDPVLVKAFSNEQNFEQALSDITSREQSNEKQELVFSLNRMREILQDKLNTYAQSAHSVLGDENSYIEGVVLRIKDSNGDIYEAKGTSSKFDDKKEVLWKTRVEILNLEKELENTIMLDVLELKTSHPATLNKAIKHVSETFSTDLSGDQAKAQFIKELIPVISDKTNGFNKVKNLTIGVVNNAEKKLFKIRSEIDSLNKLDPDSKRKTVEFYQSAVEKLEKYKSAVKGDLESLSFYVYLLGIVLNNRIGKFLSFNPSKTNVDKDDKERNKVIIWNGRAQPWHKGHDAMVQKGKSMLSKLGASAIYIMIVKGGKSSLDKETNPLSEDEQINLISSVYDGDPQVIVHPEAIASSFIGVIADALYESGNKVAGWLAGADRIDSYRSMLRQFNPEKWGSGHNFVPFETDPTGESNVVMIETPRVMSGTKARELAKTSEVGEWVASVAPEGINEIAQAAYVEVYERLSNPDLSEIVFDALNEMSAAGGGAVTGYSGGKEEEDTIIREEEIEESLPRFVSGGSMGAKRDDDELFNDEEIEMDRNKLMEELTLRKYIRRAIRIVENKNEKKKAKILSEEKKIRNYIRKVLSEAAEHHPHDNTGINVLEDLLKKIIPIFETDYKSLTTAPEQRRSYRAHIVNAVQNSLATSKASIEVDQAEPAPQAVQMGMNEEEGEELDPRKMDPKFIDIDADSPKEEPEVSPEEKFGIPGEDETGRNVAMRSWDQVETSVIDAYGVLSNPKDKELFYDYLIANLKMYFDKFEEELAVGVEEPGSEIYQQQKTDVSQADTSQTDLKL